MNIAKEKTSDIPVYLFKQGRNCRAYEFFGSHITGDRTVFRVWAPKAVSVSVVGDFNGWNEESHPMNKIADGIWELTAEGVKQYDSYKYSVLGEDGVRRMKADPYAFHGETRPANASKVYNLDGFDWTDGDYLQGVYKKDIYSSPVNVYELHAGSWKTYPDGQPLSYRALADELVPYLKEMSYTHVEFLPCLKR